MLWETHVSLPRWFKKKAVTVALSLTVPGTQACCPLPVVTVVFPSLPCVSLHFVSLILASSFLSSAFIRLQ